MFYPNKKLHAGRSREQTNQANNDSPTPAKQKQNEIFSHKKYLSVVGFEPTPV